MGFFNNIFSIFTINTYKGICGAMINSYNKVKQQNPNLSKRELYALALSLRPTWKRENSLSFTFHRGVIKLSIKENDTLKDVVRNLIILETMPDGALSNQDFFIKTIGEIGYILGEEFEDFKE